ncbi:MAG: glycosyltransferase family 4 protein [Raoultibacter sp.]
MNTHSTKQQRIAVVTMGVKLGDETRGYTRFRFLSELLAKHGFEVDLITSSFQHWDKAQRDTTKECYKNLPYNVVFINEPGYTKNLDLARIRSHAQAAKNLREHFEADPQRYDLIYAEIPPNDVARVCAEFGHKNRIPFIADINDLWPEAMRMVFNLPLISDIAYKSFTRDAKATYELLTGAVGTSDEYALRPAKDRTDNYPHITVYVGNDLSLFDAGVEKYLPEIKKPDDEVWITYAGTIGASYDIKTLIEAMSLVAWEARSNPHIPKVRAKILGDGPDREKLEDLASKLKAPVDFLGYTEYEKMAAYLAASDITINSLVKSAAQSIVTKIGDYLASGKPMINTGMSPEFREKVERDGFGVNVEPENQYALSAEIIELALHADMRKIMGARGRAIAESEFDQPRSYLKIVAMIQTLI